MIFSKKCMIFNHFLRKKNVPGQKPTMCIAMDKEIFDTDGFSLNLGWNGILFQKLLWPSVSSNNQENFCKTFAKLLRPLEQFIQTWKVRTVFGNFDEPIYFLSNVSNSILSLKMKRKQNSQIGRW